MPDIATNPMLRKALAQNIKEFMRGLGINKSELARRAGMSRCVVGRYAAGKHFPEKTNMEKLAFAMGKTPEELLALPAKGPKIDVHPAFTIKVSSRDPNKAWISVDTMVSFAAAAEIAKILSAESTSTHGTLSC